MQVYILIAVNTFIPMSNSISGCPYNYKNKGGFMTHRIHATAILFYMDVHFGVILWDILSKW